MTFGHCLYSISAGRRHAVIGVRCGLSQRMHALGRREGVSTGSHVTRVAVTRRAERRHIAVW